MFGNANGVFHAANLPGPVKESVRLLIHDFLKGVACMEYGITISNILVVFQVWLDSLFPCFFHDWVFRQSEIIHSICSRCDL